MSLLTTPPSCPRVISDRSTLVLLGLYRHVHDAEHGGADVGNLPEGHVHKGREEDLLPLQQPFDLEVGAHLVDVEDLAVDVLAGGVEEVVQEIANGGEFDVATKDVKLLPSGDQGL